MPAPISIHLATIARDLLSIKLATQQLSDQLSNIPGSLDDPDPATMHNISNALQTIVHKLDAQVKVLMTYTHKVGDLESLNP